jgi:hypothetical protein
VCYCPSISTSCCCSYLVRGQGSWLCQLNSSIFFQLIPWNAKAPGWRPPVPCLRRPARSAEGFRHWMVKRCPAGHAMHDSVSLFLSSAVWPRRRRRCRQVPPASEHGFVSWTTMQSRYL